MDARTRATATLSLEADMRCHPVAPENGRNATVRRLARSAVVLVELALMLGAFVLGSALAGLLGAANLGTALTFGTIAFAATLTWIVLRR